MWLPKGNIVGREISPVAFNFFFPSFRGNVNIGSHSSEHSLEPAKGNSSFFVDGDYVGFSEGATSAGYNYLDPNFLPSAR